MDAYRIEVAPAEAQAALAATYTLGYRLGLIVGGAGALYIADFQGWTPAYLWMAALMLVPIVTTLLAREPEAPEATVVRRIDFLGAFWQPFSSYFRNNGVLLGLVLLLFVGLFKFPDQVIGVMAGPFYLDSGYSKATSPPCRSCSASGWASSAPSPAASRSRPSASGACCSSPRWAWRCPTSRSC